MEFPWALGPPDGRYVLRGDDGEPSHVLVLSTLGAAERRRLRRRRSRKVAPEPEPAPVTTARATIIDAAAPFAAAAEAGSWLGRAGEAELAADVAILNRALHAHRLVAADPSVKPVSREQALVARVGYGEGDQVAHGRWSEARELIAGGRRRRRVSTLTPHARLAAVLGGHEHPLISEELVLRARLDLDQGREREAALQLRVTLDAALAELTGDPALARRVEELEARREDVARAAEAALTGPVAEAQRESVAFVLGRIEAAFRARAAAERPE